ncbi:hypothetical protein [Dyadobacter frigoris]|uniref:Secretion system C-terminal sorting domain-containing protein n=1 Tax=Dyadobacter frigoris TaxID=2576211 RepID=A0A4V6BJP7_9BACT|nr:hypothetical protein [Dyadobacter frigoris]TKT84443.1 hypothetical protein FDK13_34975 [Dyadobacter frigoris]GLU55601.1 hypothetical protein Dfri01_50620 [Dyadobacter frigoris]
MKKTTKTIIGTIVLVVITCISAFADEKEAKKPTGFRTGIYRSIDGKINIYVDRINKSAPTVILLSDDGGQIFYREIIRNNDAKFGRALNVDQLEDGHYTLKIMIGNEILSKSVFLAEQKVQRSLKIE